MASRIKILKVKHPIKNIFFLIGIILYLSIFVGRRMGFDIPDFINNYLTDLLVLPLVLMFALWVIRSIKKKQNLMFSTFMILAVFLYVILVFEYFLPQHKPSIYTSDWVDVLMYGFGGLAFYSFQKNQLI